MTRTYSGPFVVITGPRTVEYQDRQLDPEEAGPHDVIIETQWTMISPGTECGIYSGENPRVYEEGAWCHYPYNSGYTNIGKVVWAGDAVTSVARDDWLFCKKGHGAYYRLDTASETFLRLGRSERSPESLFARLAAIAFTAPALTPDLLGREVVIVGLGLVGQLAAQLYRLAGARVCGVDSVVSRRRTAEKCGIARTAGAVSELKEESGFDVFVDAVGRPDILLESVNYVRPHSHVMLLGSPKGDESAGGSLAFFTAVHRKGVRVVGALESVFPQDAPEGMPSRMEFLRKVMKMIDSGELTIEPLLTHRLAYREVQSAYEGLIENKEHYLGVVLEWR